MENKETIEPGETGSMEAAFGENDAMFRNGEPEDATQDNRTVGDKIAAMPVEEDDSGQVHPSKVEPVSEKVVQGDKYAPELPITHLKNPVNNKVFAATPDLMKRRDLVPCDEDGKKVYDHRCL